MNLLRISSKSITRVSQFASLTRRPEYRLFSTEAPAAQFQHQRQIPLPSPLPTPNLNAAKFDPFHGSQPSGAFIARLSGITKHTSKSDILNLLSDPALSLEDIKHDYSLSFFAPLSVLVKFPSRQAYDVETRSLARKGRYKLEKERDANKWDALQPYNGKYVLLHEIPRNALPEDVSRLLSGCPHDASSIQIFTSPRRMAIVGFPSQELAMHAYITKNRKPCLNQEMKMQVLY